MRNGKNIRTCKGCFIKEDKKNFLRIYLNEENKTLLWSISNISEGRGMYIHKNKKCVEKALTERSVKYSIKRNIKYEEIQRIKKEIIEFLEGEKNRSNR